ncbi:predicted protein [Botrytis cinerea T4]|uniref:Uncharacterized protein n=1 Tax=Botryotinia fuckeliana (strain T4) TaxID=999810 RepID=G2XZJ2_BOTF4|nr:predicted protein [Botrytis cinerea T4]
MLFLQPVDLPDPVYRDIVARPGHTYEKPCILVLYAAIPPTPTVDSILLLASLRLAPSAPSRELSQLETILHKRHARVNVINQ